MPQPRLALAAIFLVAALAGCTAEGASKANFSLTPSRVGWFAGDEALFHLNLTTSLLNHAPSFTIDRSFAIERVRFVEEGMKFGGNFETRNPDDVSLRLQRDGAEGQEITLSGENASMEIIVTIPSDLRDSEYVLELELFKVGWVKSEPFRVDRRA